MMSCKKDCWMLEVGVVLLVFAAALAALLYAQLAHAGGGEYEAPIVRGRCNPMVIPEDTAAEGWRWLKSHERHKISAGGVNEIQDFQTMYCREFTSTGGLLREYVISVEWWRPKLKKPSGKVRVTDH